MRSDGKKPFQYACFFIREENLTSIYKKCVDFDGVMIYNKYVSII